jgi:hypothetical protein
MQGAYFWKGSFFCQITKECFCKESAYKGSGVGYGKLAFADGSLGRENGASSLEK